jgi:hypothetical protein
VETGNTSARPVYSAYFAAVVGFLATTDSVAGSQRDYVEAGDHPEAAQVPHLDNPKNGG